jgi:hypothetical protein
MKRSSNGAMLSFHLAAASVGDIAGFAASIYLRGLPFIQLPTYAARANRLVCWRQNRCEFVPR